MTHCQPALPAKFRFVEMIISRRKGNYNPARVLQVLARFVCFFLEEVRQVPARFGCFFLEEARQVPARFGCIFAYGKNYCSHQFLNWWQQHATGMLHLHHSNLGAVAPKKSQHTIWCAVIFLEVPARFELANESFADSCLTTWPRYHMK